MDPVHIFLDPRSMDPFHGLGLWTGHPCFVLFPMFAGHQCLWKTLVVVKYKKGKWLKLVKSQKHLTVVEFTKPRSAVIVVFTSLVKTWQKLPHWFFFNQNQPWVHYFGVIWIMVIDPGSFRSNCIKGADESINRVGSFVALLYHDLSDLVSLTDPEWYKMHSNFMFWYVPVFKSHEWHIFENKQYTEIFEIFVHKL